MKESKVLVSWHTPACWFLWVRYHGIALWLLWRVVTEEEKPLLVVITFFPSKSLLHFPTDTFPPPPCLSVSQGACAIYLFYMSSPSYIMLYQFPLISTHFLCLLSYSHSFPQPTFHPILWGVFLSDIDWIYLWAAVKVSLVILCCLLGC